MLESRRPVAASGINFGESMIARGLPTLIPRRFVESIVGFAYFGILVLGIFCSILSECLVPQTKTQLIIGFTIVRVRIAEN